MHPKKRTVGVRIPDHPVVRALLEELGEPLLSSTLLMPGESEPMTDGWQIKDELDQLVGRGDRLRRVRVGADHRRRLLRRRARGGPVGAGDPSRFE